MLQQDVARDYVVSTGVTHSVRDFCDAAFSFVGLDYCEYVIEDPKFFRPAEVDLLIGNSTLARELLGWEPKYTFKELVEEMVTNDLALLSGKQR